MKKILQFSFAILLAYAVSKFAFYLYDIYWNMSSQIWGSAPLPIIIQTSLLITIRIFIVIRIIRYLRQIQYFANFTTDVTDWEMQNIPQWIMASLLSALAMICAFTVFLDFLSIIGLIAVNTLFG